MRKKIIIMSVGSLLVLVLAGCGNSSVSKDESKSISNATQAQEQVKAQNENASQDKNGAPSLPAEALTACTDKSEGDSCVMTMTLPQKGETDASADTSQEVSGTCKLDAKSEQLACAPQGGQGGQGGPGGAAPSDQKPAATN